VLEYPRDWEALIDEAALREYAAGAFEFHLVKHPMLEARARLGQQEGVSSLTPLELLEVYWRAGHVEEADHAALQKLALQIMEETEDID
jgi:exonuclease SbcD